MQRLVRYIRRCLGLVAGRRAPARTHFLDVPEAIFEPDLQSDPWHEALAAPSEIDVGARITNLCPIRNIIVQGWRFLPHSYAIVNQWQLLALLRRGDIAVKVQDAPFYRPHWHTKEGVFEPLAEQALRSIETAPPDERADLTLRISVPFDFSASSSGKTAIFGTLEYQTIDDKLCPDPELRQRFRQGLGAITDVKVVTPSRWSAEGFYKAGFRAEQVVVVPHGVDAGTFRPMPKLRGPVRRKIAVSDEEFVFLSIGAMTPNKGVDLLLQAFSEVSRRFPNTRLILKGVNSLYHSRHRLHRIMQKVPLQDQRRVLSRLTYFGASFSNRQVALLFQAADAYVSSYRAEGFNMPVLEAAACGIPVICTRGGATDDFVNDAFARRIESKRVSFRAGEQEFVSLAPDLDHLIALMTAAIQNRAWRDMAAEAGPKHVLANYTWDHAVDKLLTGLLN